MLKLIMGEPGSGKTKQLIDLANNAITLESGNVICIETNQKLRYDINHKVKLIEADLYPFYGYEGLLAFIAGITASNFDVTHIFIDSLFNVAGCSDISETEEFLAKLYDFSTERNIKFTVTITEGVEKATEGMKVFF